MKSCDIRHNFVSPAKLVAADKNLKDRIEQFALRVMRLYRALPRHEEARIIGRQMQRSGTSVGATYRAACRARSKAEFVAKLGIVLEEADETVFFLELLQESSLVSAQKLAPLVKDGNSRRFS